MTLLEEAILILVMISSPRKGLVSLNHWLQDILVHMLKTMSHGLMYNTLRSGLRWTTFQDCAKPVITYWMMQFLQEARFPQLRSLTSEQRTKLKASFVHFDDPSFCEWMRSLKVVPPQPSWWQRPLACCCIFQLLGFYVLCWWSKVCLHDLGNAMRPCRCPQDSPFSASSHWFCSLLRNVQKIASCKKKCFFWGWGFEGWLWQRKFSQFTVKMLR